MDVRVVYRKYDESLHWHLTMRRLGEDEHGVWLGSPAGSSMRKCDDPPVLIPHAHVGLIPRDAWWTAWFNDAPQRIEIYCDITTRPRWPGPDEVTMIDLDLDVARVRDTGEVLLLDEDEFAEHQTRYAYPATVVEQARAAAVWLHAALADGTEPFASQFRSWLALVS